MFNLDHLYVVDAGGKPRRVDTPLGIAVISQSCDTSQPSKDHIHVAPVVRLDGTARAEALNGKRIAYAALPQLDPGHFADLDTITTVHKNALADKTRTPGVHTDHDTRRFAGTVSRKFGRFAFPDEVVWTLQPLRDILASKARKEATPLGKLLTHIYAIRVEAQNNGGWLNAPYDLSLVVIFNEGVLPYPRADDNLPAEPAELRTSLSLAPGQPAIGKEATIADILNRPTTPMEHRYWLWQYLLDAWAQRCEQAADQCGVRAIIASVSAEPIPVDEFPLSRANNSEDLDLDYLSEPLPRAPKSQT
ncbi:hypothetical protein ASD11_14180 [Aeromicrobium sp. Root495]|nr:hypothetical protein ASD11_14180 [Aeromicrobium sp. Root495]